ncbi:MAG: hypothetical protein PHQ27_11260, partial [Victivallales bacterium]|nr:hypothetical protein [Victivallales bacterium]
VPGKYKFGFSFMAGGDPAEAERYQYAANSQREFITASPGELDNQAVSAALAEAKAKAADTYGSLMNPFAVYLSAIGYLYEDNRSEALVDFRNLYRMNPHNPLTNRDYVTLGRSLHENFPAALAKVKPYPYSLTDNIVFVIFAAGRGPALKQVKFQIVLPWVGYTGVAFPRYEFFPTAYSGLQITAAGADYRTVTVADMDKVAAQEYIDRLPVMITRIVIGYLVKETAALAATQAAGSQGWGAEALAYGATGVYKYLFNTADTRCWETLPKEYQVTHLPLPPDRRLTLAPLRKTMPGQSVVLQLKKTTRFAIVYVRAGATRVLNYKVMEFP